MTTENLIRIGLVDDHFEIHRIVQEILSATDDIRLVGLGANGRK
jgi:chemotaxis response regulator CheB